MLDPRRVIHGHSIDALCDDCGAEQDKTLVLLLLLLLNGYLRKHLDDGETGTIDHA